MSNTNTVTELAAWNHELGVGYSVTVEVPHKRDAGCAIVGARAGLPAGAHAELCHYARVLTETPGGVSCSTPNGWTISR